MLSGSSRRICAAAAGATLFLLAGPTLANGRFPTANQGLVDPGDPSHLLLRVTYGLVQSFDAGKTWSWTCEQALGTAGSNLDPSVVVTRGGAIVAGLFQGLNISRDRGCSWDLSRGILEGRYVIDLTIERPDNARIVALVSSARGDASSLTLAESSDDAQSWAALGTSPANDFLGVTVDVAPSRHERIYLSGRSGPSAEPAFVRSDDRGQTWISGTVPIPPSSTPYIAAIDPNDPNRVYVRTQDATSGDELMVTSDAGDTWNHVFRAQSLQGFALSPDGRQVAAGGLKDGLSIASSDDYVFAKVSSAQIECLTWLAPGLYACGRWWTDGFTLGLTHDRGATFESLYRLPDLGVQQCPPNTTAGRICASVWPTTANLIGADAGLPSVGSDAGAETNLNGPLTASGGCSMGGAPSGSLAWVALLVGLGRHLRRPVRTTRARERCRRY